MVAWDAGADLAARFRAHAGNSETLYGYAMRGMADDWAAGGPVRAVCAGYEQAPHGSVLQLRLLAGVFRLVLTGRAPELRPFYACLGGSAPPEGVWPVMREVVARHVEELTVALEVPPQTNETGRSAALLAGLFDIVAASGIDRLRLLELGASAGLNLLVDQFRFTGPGWAYGPPDSVLRLDDVIEGLLVRAPFTIVDRRGCDLHPVDASSPEGRLLLTSFVWPFQVHRHERLAAALTIAARHPVTVDAASASDWLETQLAPDTGDGLPVIWQSITQLYWPPAEVRRVAEVLAAYGQHRPLARVAMEFPDHSPPNAKPEIWTTVWQPGEEPRVRRLGTAHDHGVPVRLG
jgi:hypothetical protein